MPHRTPDPRDPMTLTGVGFECEDDTPTHEMAECFVEEFLRSGVPADEVLELFRKPDYAAAHQAYQALGEEVIAQMVHDFAHAYRPIRIVDAPDQITDRGQDGGCPRLNRRSTP